MCSDSEASPKRSCRASCQQTSPDSNTVFCCCCCCCFLTKVHILFLSPTRLKVDLLKQEARSRSQGLIHTSSQILPWSRVPPFTMRNIGQSGRATSFLCSVHSFLLYRWPGCLLLIRRGKLGQIKGITYMNSIFTGIRLKGMPDSSISTLSITSPRLYLT